MQRQCSSYQEAIGGFLLHVVRLETNFAKLIRIENLWPEHEFLDLLPLFQGQIRIQDHKFPRINHDFHSLPSLVQKSVGDRRLDLVIVCKGREEAGLESTHRDDRVRLVNWLGLRHSCARHQHKRGDSRDA